MYKCTYLHIISLYRSRIIRRTLFGKFSFNSRSIVVIFSDQGIFVTRSLVLLMLLHYFGELAATASHCDGAARPQCRVVTVQTSCADAETRLIRLGAPDPSLGRRLISRTTFLTTLRLIFILYIKWITTQGYCLDENEIRCLSKHVLFSMQQFNEWHHLDIQERLVSKLNILLNK